MKKLGIILLGLMVGLCSGLKAQKATPFAEKTANAEKTV